MINVTLIRVSGQLTNGGRVSLLSEEETNLYHKGQVIKTVRRTTFHKMSTPKTVRVFENGTTRRVECVRSWN